MHHLYLRRKQNESIIEIEFLFEDHTLSPANQIVTRLFRQMLLAVESKLTTLEVEYVDVLLAKQMGIGRSTELLQRLGATKDNIRENRKENVVLSRSFRAPLSGEALQYFKRIQDLEELSAFSFWALEEKKVEVYFARRISAFFTSLEEAKFLQLLEEDRIRYKIV
ncbi:hypothetical protein [Ammoniphilus sp. YIM 78166]|uniref:hypothetical protein n=1 Tax=Ammoniphilus sp. YIM 78166 TaxID=1644106 RepID=UPI0010703933|nr:hypothetical protein [Ammoniphilus sp. YIM 78166]